MSKNNEVIGVVRSIGKLGRVCIPAEYRKILKLKDDDLVSITLVGKKIEISKYEG